jgi:hypothetical protein
MDDRARHFSAVLIAFLFGVAALVPTCSFTENLQSTTIHEVHSSSTTVQFVFIPGLFFAITALLSGLAIWRAGLLPAGISFSWVRIAGGTLFAIFVYPAAFAVTGFAVMILFFTASADSSPAVAHPTLKFLVGFVVFGGIVWFIVVVAAVFLALAFAFATRFWPRRVFLWAVTLSALPIVWLRSFNRSSNSRQYLACAMLRTSHSPCCLATHGGSLESSSSASLC